MSIKLMAAAWELDIPQTEKMVLLCLCDHANDSGECWPSIARLAAKCSVTDRTVQKAIQGLKARGILSWSDAPGRSHKFVIDPRRIFTPEEYSPPKNVRTPPKQVHPTPENASPKTSRTIKEPPKVSADADDFTFEDFAESWNEVAAANDLPALKAKTKARVAAFKARKREFPQIENWQAAFRTLRTSKFLRGDNDRGWKATADFVLQAKTFPKLVEGAYG